MAAKRAAAAASEQGAVSPVWAVPVGGNAGVECRRCHARIGHVQLIRPKLLRCGCVG